MGILFKKKDIVRELTSKPFKHSRSWTRTVSTAIREATFSFYDIHGNRGGQKGEKGNNVHYGPEQLKAPAGGYSTPRSEINLIIREYLLVLCSIVCSVSPGAASGASL